MDEDYNIQELRNGQWITRYRKNVSLREATEKYVWLTTTPFWQEKADDYRVIKFEYSIVPIDVKEGIK